MNGEQFVNRCKCFLLRCLSSRTLPLNCIVDIPETNYFETCYKIGEKAFFFNSSLPLYESNRNMIIFKLYTDLFRKIEYAYKTISFLTFQSLVNNLLIVPDFNDRIII